jgi:hypothetical protein
MTSQRQSFPYLELVSILRHRFLAMFARADKGEQSGCYLGHAIA